MNVARGSRRSRWPVVVLLAIAMLGTAAAALAADRIEDGVSPAPDSLEPADSPITITLHYRAASPVAASAISVRLDGEDISASCGTGANYVSCQPAQPLSAGRHDVDVTIGRLRKQWSFDAATPPAAVEILPATGTVLPPGAWPTVSGRLVDAVSELMPSTFALTVDDVDVTASTEFTHEAPGAASFRYRPAQPPAAGDHRATVRIESRNGLGLVYGSSFVIDTETTYSVDVIVPADGAVVTEPDCLVLVAVGSNKRFPEAVMIDRQPATLRSVEPKPWVYAASVRLKPGANVIRVEATYEDDQARTAQITVTYDSAARGTRR